MKRTRFEQICAEVDYGKQHTVEHDITHREGTIVACRRDKFVIDAADHMEDWARQNCRERE